MTTDCSSRIARTPFLRIALVSLAFVAAASAGDEETPSPDALFKSQRWEAAAAAYDDETRARPDDQTAWFRLGYALHALGRYADAVGAHERAATLVGPAVGTAAYNAACAHALLDHPDRAAEWLGTSAAAGSTSATMVDTDADFDGVRDHPAFVAARNALAEQTIYRSLRSPAPPGDRDQFDFWLGDWDTQNFARNGAGPWTPAGGLECRIFEVLGGHALVEWSRGTRPGGPSHGFSIRTFDTAKQEWIVLLLWPSQDNPQFSVLTGRFRHGRGEIVSGLLNAAATGQTRFTFSDASPTGYLWDSATTSDGGNTWRSTLLFEGTRRAADAPPLTTGPSTSNAHCSGEVFRQLDFRLGRWTGTQRTRRESGATGVTGVTGASLSDHTWVESPVTMHAASYMDGSALVEEWVVGAGDKRRASYVIQAFEPGRGAWVRYELDDDSPHFRRFTGAADADGITYFGTPGPGSSGAPGTLVLGRARDGVMTSHREVDGRRLWERELRAAP